MFVPHGPLPWEVTPPPLPPLGGLLTMLERKEGVRPSLLPFIPPVPRTAACVVLPQSTTSPALTISPRLITTPTHAPYSKASSPPAAPPLKFGVERLLAVEPRRDYSPMVPASALLTPPLPTSLPTSCPAYTSAPAPCVTSSALTCPSVSPGMCGCGVGRGGAECGYYYPHQLYTPRPHHLITYTSLYGGSVGAGGHRHEVLGVTQGSHGRRKRTWTRAVFSNLQRKGLEKRFQLQKYITKPDRRQLAATLGLTDAQVKVWFQNRRMKWRHAELKRREQTQQVQQQQQEQQQQESDPSKEREGSEEQEQTEAAISLPDDREQDDDEDEEIDLGSEMVTQNNINVI